MVKRRRAVTNDRLSTLPDVIISQILSSLDTKQAVQTCILSKRWTYLWTSLSTLNFYSTSFAKLQSFDRFVQRVLSLHDHSIRITDLNFSRRRSMSRRLFKKVINYTFSHNVEHLYFHYEDIGDCGYPDYLYSSNSLKKLHISFGYWQSLRKPLSFEQLTVLHLKMVSFIEPDLFSSCPKLVELSIVNCSSPLNLDTLSICAPQLARLSIVISSGSGSVLECKIVVIAPKLTSFTLDSNHPLKLYSKNDFPLLDSLIINLNVYLPRTPGEIDKRLSLGLISMLNCLRKARSVTLSFNTVKLLSMFPSLLEHESSPFDNLKTLKLRQLDEHVPSKLPSQLMTVMAYFINNSPDAEIVLDFPRCQYCWFVDELNEFANKRNSS